MSVVQVQEILNGVLSTGSSQRPRENNLYFSYGSHLSFTEFHRKYPQARILGIGFLDNWTWHLNSLGLFRLISVKNGSAKLLNQGNRTFDQVQYNMKA
jgi:hypothetical protein